MGDENVEIGVHACFVASLREGEKLPGRLHGLFLLLDLLGKNANRRHGVFDLLESSEDRLAIGGDVRVVDGDELVYGGAAEAGIENRFGDGKANGPETAGPGEEILESRAFETALGYFVFLAGQSDYEFDGRNGLDNGAG